VCSRAARWRWHHLDRGPSTGGGQSWRGQLTDARHVKKKTSCDEEEGSTHFEVLIGLIIRVIFLSLCEKIGSDTFFD
jgi:hypothetical protein